MPQTQKPKKLFFLENIFEQVVRDLHHHSQVKYEGAETKLCLNTTKKYYTQRTKGQSRSVKYFC